MLDHESLRFVFGLKLRHLRKLKGYGLKDLSDRSGVSISYINEIEKGKKYPKTDKILILADALGESYENLVSLRLENELEVFSELLKHNILKGMPFDFFGIPTGSVLEIFGENPDKLKALIATIFELQKTYNISVEEFFSTVLRSLVDAKGYYFPELEKVAQQFRQVNAIENCPESAITGRLKEILIQNFQYEIMDIDFAEHSPHLANLHFIFQDTKKRRLLINTGLNQKTINYILARELGYSVLELKERLTSSADLEIDAFDKLYNQFKAAYFAGCLLIPREKILSDLSQFLAYPRWNPNHLRHLLSTYVLPVRVCMHRALQTLPSSFAVTKTFLIEIDCSKQEHFTFSHQLHLSEQHAPYNLHTSEHYCNKWVALSAHKIFDSENDEGYSFYAQRSFFMEDQKEYLCITAVFKPEPKIDKTTSITIGFLLDDFVKQIFRFWGDPEIPTARVSQSCERCHIKNCDLRAAAPVLVEKERSENLLRQSIKDILKTVSE